MKLKGGVLIGLFRSINFYIRIYTSSTHVRALEKFLLHFFLLALIDTQPGLRYLYSLVLLTKLSSD
jgi:hypothetical protein